MNSPPASHGIPVQSIDLSTAPTLGAGRYSVLAKLAEGGMAGVYLAWDRQLKVERAVKVLLPEFAEGLSLRSRFETEAHTMANLRHPNVIQVFDVGTEEALPYIVMEFARGGSLIGWCEAFGSMPPRRASLVMGQVARGIVAAHEAGVVHRDVKPHNVLISAEGVCKVTDFGIAQVAHLSGMTRTGSTMGTIGYMAPEQRSDAKGVDHRADVYSLGAVLYKLLTNSVVTDLFLVEHEPDLLAGIPPALHEVLLRSCFHDRMRRFQTAAEFAKTLNEVLELLPGDPPGTPELTASAPETARGDRADFAEIAEVLGGPVSDSANSSPATLPYTMPQRGRRSASSMGSSTRGDRASDPHLAPPPPELTGDTPKLARSPGPRPTASAARTGLVRGLAVAAVAAWALLIGFSALGAFETRASATREATALDALHTVLVDERGVLAELAGAGTRPETMAELTRLHGDLGREDPAGRRQATARYAAAIDAAAADLASQQALVRTRNVRRAFETWRDARVAWIETARSVPGRLATGLRLAPRP